MSTPAARKQATYRKRQRAGLAVLRVPAPSYELTAALIASGRLTAAQALDRAQVERATGEVLSEWSRAWLAAHGCD